MTLGDNHVQLRDVLGRLEKINGGVSVKVVNNELRIQRVDTGSLQKGSQRYDCNCVAVLYRGP